MIAGVNVANLQLGRMRARQREISVRTALGATRLAMVRQILVENLLLSALGGVAALLLVHWSAGWAAALLSQVLPYPEDVRIDAWVLVATLVTVGVLGIASGLAPALAATRQDRTLAMTSSASGTWSTPGRDGRLLLIGEVALTVVLLVAAGLLMRSLQNLTAIPPGLRPAEHPDRPTVTARGQVPGRQPAVGALPAVAGRGSRVARRRVRGGGDQPSGDRDRDVQPLDRRSPFDGGRGTHSGERGRGQRRLLPHAGNPPAGRPRLRAGGRRRQSAGGHRDGRIRAPFFREREPPRRAHPARRRRPDVRRLADRRGHRRRCTPPRPGWRSHPAGLPSAAADLAGQCVPRSAHRAGGHRRW